MSLEIHIDWQGRTRLTGRLRSAERSPAVSFEYASEENRQRHGCESRAKFDQVGHPERGRLREKFIGESDCGERKDRHRRQCANDQPAVEPLAPRSQRRNHCYDDDHQHKNNCFEIHLVNGNQTTCNESSSMNRFRVRNGAGLLMRR